MFDTISLQLVSVSCTKDLVAGDFRSDNLADDITIGEADYQAVFGSIVLVFSLSDETFAGVVVGLSRAATLVFRLVSA
jgi:hypothetical protein